MSRARLGPARLHGSAVVIRPPRLADYPAWRRIRLRDQRLIEPFWYSSPSSWTDRHTEKQWLREYLVATFEARAGRRVAGVIEIDGRFTGQCELVAIDRRCRTAELSIWIDSRLGRHGFAGLAAGLVLDHGFQTLGLERIVAPISPANIGAAHGAEQLGFVREALMARYFDVGGARRDHDLWAVTRADVPADGFAGRWVRRIEAKATGIVPVLVEHDPDEGLRRRALLVAPVLARLLAGRVRRRLLFLRGAGPIRLPVPGHPGAVVRSRRLADGPGWRDAHPAARPLGRCAWWREFSRSRGGLRSPGGLVLVLDIDGYAGEFRLFDLDMFDRNARLFAWADPARADIGVRTAATRAVVDYAFHTLGLYRVATEIDATDTESAAVVARAGLLEEGIMRNHAGPTGRRGDHALWASTIATRPGRA
ncbi:GNAT family N-acetyltransferase [Nocardia pseudobrasiliensis]|uniref:Ribosomal-protein-alanine N-acetyltransferase n=1 Tax=Nocardia pseudobrasiliensis TaxID=45979 RepID=A0A370IAI4_9NOCA|nr:GNAT family protein [Nocardia pseudobrasiliensis]RDI67746.1 ribosomal-protein-alanine N-acetyltransferase [Nocardia pseudobrasiliensis]